MKEIIEQQLNEHRIEMAYEGTVITRAKQAITESQSKILLLTGSIAGLEETLRRIEAAEQTKASIPASDPAAETETV